MIDESGNGAGFDVVGMTALEEIKKAEHERIWLEPAGAPYRCWCQDNQWGDEGVEYVLASTIESLQRENDELREKAALHSADAKTAWAECDELRGLADRLKMEAQTHAIEARGANATINEIYQIISGGKGEPGSWNGAEPVRAYVEAAKGEILRLETELALSKPVYSRRQLEARAEAAEAEVKRLQAEIDRKSSMPGDHRYWEGRYRDEAAENEKLRGVVERAQLIVSTSIYPSWHETAIQALASTGGEHHAE